MAKTTINNGDAGNTARAAINNNFTEVYTGLHIHNATAKTAPVDNDEVGLIDSAASNVLKKVTWANVKAALKTYFDPLYVAARSFGTAAALDAGTGADNIVQLDGSGRLPAVDGSQLTGISGGGGAPALASWTYEAGGGTPSSGFTADTAPSSTTLLKFAAGAFGAYGVGSVWGLIPTGTILVLTNPTGSASFIVTGTAGGALGRADISVSSMNGDASLTWGGNYQVSFVVTPQNAIQVGLGNVTNNAQIKTIGASVAIQKGSGSGQLTDAVAGTDYLAPAGYGAALTGITAAQVGAISSGAVIHTGPVGNVVLLADYNGIPLLATDNTGLSSSGNPYLQGHDSSDALSDTIGFNSLGQFAVSGTAVPLTLAAHLAAASITPIADGTYTVGIGGSTSGTITIQSGIITAVTQAS